MHIDLVPRLCKSKLERLLFANQGFACRLQVIHGGRQARALCPGFIALGQKRGDLLFETGNRGIALGQGPGLSVQLTGEVGNQVGLARTLALQALNVVLETGCLLLGQAERAAERRHLTRQFIQLGFLTCDGFS